MGDSLGKPHEDGEVVGNLELCRPQVANLRPEKELCTGVGVGLELSGLKIKNLDPVQVNCFYGPQLGRKAMACLQHTFEMHIRYLVVGLYG